MYIKQINNDDYEAVFKAGELPSLVSIVRQMEDYKARQKDQIISAISGIPDLPTNNGK